MPAKLVVISGAAAGTEFPIQDPVLRIGSGSQCEFCVKEPSLAAHAVTVEFVDQGYMLHNRSEDPVELGGERLDLRDSARWPSGDEANLGHGLVIRLDIEGDPAPAKVAGPSYTIEYDPEEPDETKKPRKSSAAKNLQLFVIIAAVPLCAWMLMAQSEEQKLAVPPVSFTKLVKKLEDSKTDAARGVHSFRATLQRARTAELRGDAEEARAAYGSVRDALLVQPKSPDGSFKDVENNDVWQYTTRRLQALYGGESP